MANQICIICGHQREVPPSKQFRKYCSVACFSVAMKRYNVGGIARRGKGNWKNSKRERKVSGGYVFIYVPKYPKANPEGYYPEHRLIMERSIGRLLSNDEIVHHINQNRGDNRIENLELQTMSKHVSFHNNGIKNPNWKGGVTYHACQQCKKSYRGKSKGKFCSKKCCDESFKKDKIEKICLMCNSIFWVVPSQEKRRKFCSYKCAYGYRHI